MLTLSTSFFFFFNDTATTEIYTLSLHDALPICRHPRAHAQALRRTRHRPHQDRVARSEEHTSELQSLAYLVCRLLLEKKKQSSAPRLTGSEPGAPPRHAGSPQPRPAALRVQCRR